MEIVINTVQKHRSPITVTWSAIEVDEPEEGIRIITKQCRGAIELPEDYTGSLSPAEPDLANLVLSTLGEEAIRANLAPYI